MNPTSYLDQWHKSWDIVDGVFVLHTQHGAVDPQRDDPRSTVRSTQTALPNHQDHHPRCTHRNLQRCHSLCHPCRWCRSLAPQKPTLLGYSILWLSSEPKMAPNHTMKGSMPGACPAFLSNYGCFHHPLSSSTLLKHLVKSLLQSNQKTRIQSEAHLVLDDVIQHRAVQITFNCLLSFGLDVTRNLCETCKLLVCRAQRLHYFCLADIRKFGNFRFAAETMCWTCILGVWPHDSDEPDARRGWTLWHFDLRRQSTCDALDTITKLSAEKKRLQHITACNNSQPLEHDLWL